MNAIPILLCDLTTTEGLAFLADGICNVEKCMHFHNKFVGLLLRRNSSFGKAKK